MGMFFWVGKKIENNEKDYEIWNKSSKKLSKKGKKFKNDPICDWNWSISFKLWN